MQEGDVVDRLLVSLHLLGGATPIGNGFIVSPRHVLTADRLIPPGLDASPGEVTVAFAGLPGLMATTATVVQRMPEAHAALLELARPLRPEVPVPPLDGASPIAGASWRCAFASPSIEVGHASGVVFQAADGSPTVLISPHPGAPEGTAPPLLWPPPVGAPIAFGDAIAGMVIPPDTAGQQSPPWRAVLAQRLLETSAAAVWRNAQAAAQPEPQSTSSGTADPLDGFVEQLAPSARRALDHANGLRVRIGQPALHMEHLVAGLAENPSGLPCRRLAAANIKQKDLRAIVAQAGGSPLLDDYSPLAVGTLPPLSGHVRCALERALQRQADMRTAKIHADDLFFAALTLEECTLIQRLREKGVTPVSVLADDTAEENGKDGHGARKLADLGSDQPRGDDRLGIRDEVDALAEVIASSTTDPPLAIGLFGEWGSGKSFFMGKMRAGVDALAAESRAQGGASFCREIVQISFNAWHYVDTNLWASLLTELFEGLSAHLKRKEKAGETEAVQRARLLTRVASTKDVMAEAEKDKAAAESAVQVATARIERLEVERRRVESTLSGGVVRAAVRDLLLEKSALSPPAGESQAQRDTREAEEDFRAKVDAAMATLGVPLDQATAELKATLVEARGPAALWKTLSQGMTPRVKLALAAVVVGLALLASLPWATIAGWLREGPLQSSAALASLLAVASPIVVALRPWLKHTFSAMRALKEARRSQQKAIDEGATAKKAELEAERSELQKKASEAHGQLERAAEDLRQLEVEIDRLRADRRMIDFVRERSTSTDYTRYQGIMARAQHDFQLLSDLLSATREEAGRGAAEAIDRADLPSIDRIVLYIDDLDRCPPNKVFDVLQAVHLLLGYPLFVVVVGVDPRWLLHSVRARASALGGDEGAEGSTARPVEAESEWLATPMDYLEKIFQIPFTLRPMSETGFGDLIEDLARASSGGAHDAVAKPSPPAEAGVQPAPAPPAGGPSPAPAAPANAVPAPTAAVASAPAPAPGGAAAPTAGARKMERLELIPAEQKFMKRLFEFIPSPRATKRFVNVYRLIRASAGELRQDLSGDDEWGDHRAVLLLLAILTGYPKPATEILEALLIRHHDETWWEFVEGFRARSLEPTAEAEPWRELLRKLDRVDRRLIPLHKSCWYFERWARQVARYSFQSGRVLIAQRRAEDAELQATIATASPPVEGGQRAVDGGLRAN